MSRVIVERTFTSASTGNDEVSDRGNASRPVSRAVVHKLVTFVTLLCDPLIQDRPWNTLTFSARTTVLLQFFYRNTSASIKILYVISSFE